MFYISEIYNYCYLKNRKEILLLQEKNKEQRPIAMAKTDLEGNITFYNEIKPKINDKFILPEPSNISKYNGYLCIINGLCNDKYIIIKWQHTIEFYDYKVQGYIPELEYSINIYNADNLNELLEKNLDIYYFEDFFKGNKIADNLFILDDTKNLFYYNENDNKIEFIVDIFNYIDNNNKKIVEQDHPNLDNINLINYFYLSDKMFAILDNEFYLYIVDISNKEKKIVREIKLNLTQKDDNFKIIKYLYYHNQDNKEFLYISFVEQNENTYEEKMIHGIIKSNKD